MKNTIRFSSLLLSVVISANAFAGTLSADHLGEVTAKSLNFLMKDQYPEPTGYYDKGEWPVNMKSYLFPSMVGLGRLFARPSQEPTAFATSSIINILTEAYLLEPKLTSIPSIVNRALPSLAGYREGDVFHYYPLIEFQGLKLHGPKDPHYVPRKMMSLALVPPDADTTAVSFLAMAHGELLNEKKPVSEFQVPEGTLKAFSDFRDNDRKAHPYNRMMHVNKSGAYLTWLWDEHAKSSSFFRSMNDKPKKGYRIVFGRNDVDCVVNANVLRLLSATNNKNQEGYADACEMLNETILKNRTNSCGVYYPNTFNPLYTASAAYKSGAACLEKSRRSAIDFMLSRQNEDGSWSNDPGMGREDRVQSTAWAVSAMLNYADQNDLRDQRLHNSIRFATNYLLSQAKIKGNDQIYWPGEVFFSGSAAARNTLLWRSDAYTTASVFLTLLKVEKFMKKEVTP